MKLIYYIKLISAIVFAFHLAAQESQLRPEAEACLVKFQNTDSFQTGGKLTRTYLAMQEIDENCRVLISSLPIFKRDIESIISDYNTSIENGLTIDLEMYNNINGLIGTVPEKRFIDKVLSNRVKGSERCGGDNARDFRRDFPEKLPEIRDQGSTGWCYAYTVADLVSFKSGKAISARHIAQTNNQAINEEILIYGAYNSLARLIGAAEKTPDHLPDQNVDSIKSAFNGYVTPTLRDGGIEQTSFLRTNERGGFCLEEDIPSGSFEENDIGEIIEIFKTFDNNLLAAVTAEDKNDVAMSFCQEQSLIIRNYLPNGFERGVMDALIQGSTMGSLAYLSKEQCQETVDMSAYITDVAPRVNAGDTIRNLDYYLDKNDLAAVAYDTDFLGQNRFDDNGNLIENAHSSSIIGRRFNEEAGRCQYLLRNSWGTDCSVYPEHTNIECVEGNVWIGEDDLDFHSHNVTGLYK